MGITSTNALVEARHMVRGKTEVNVPVIILLQLPLMLWLVAKMKATGVASTTAGLRWSRRIQIGATAMIVARYLPLSSGSLLSARMQQDIRANPLFLLVVSAPASFIDRRLLVPFAAEAMERYSRSQNLFALLFHQTSLPRLWNLDPDWATPHCC